MGKTPRPGLRRKGSSWCIYWRHGKTIQEISAGDLAEADAETRRMEVELALRTGTWPDWAARKPAVLRLASRGSSPADGDLIDAFAEHARATVSIRWASQVVSRLRSCGLDLATLTPQQAASWLDDIAKAKTIATRNRALAILGKFYRWACDTNRLRMNPVHGMRQGKERDAGAEISHLSRQERDQVIEAAYNLPDGLATWLALYAGLRRQEIWRAEWQHVNLAAGRLLVPIAKTGRRRVVPIAAPLAKRLRSSRSDSGRIVPWPDGYWPMCEAEMAHIRALSDVCHGLPIGWTVFRHTFGSLLAQAGVSLDKISSWMGNTPHVCRKHYAQFVPRDRRDEEIDRL